MKREMDNELRGSDLTRAMLEHGDQQIWCAIDDDSDERAIIDHDFTAYIVAFKDGLFHCTGGMQWLYAVPIKIKEITHQDVKW